MEKQQNKPKVYISGAVSFIPYEKAKAMFSEAEEFINATGEYEAVNPLRFDEGDIAGKSWEYFMRKDIKLLMECDYIHFLPNWEISRGANLECLIARELNIQTLIF